MRWPNFSTINSDWINRKEIFYSFIHLFHLKNPAQYCAQVKKKKSHILNLDADSRAAKPPHGCVKGSGYCFHSLLVQYFTNAWMKTWWLEVDKRTARTTWCIYKSARLHCNLTSHLASRHGFCTWPGSVWVRIQPPKMWDTALRHRSADIRGCFQPGQLGKAEKKDAVSPNSGPKNWA